MLLQEARAVHGRWQLGLLSRGPVRLPQRLHGAQESDLLISEQLVRLLPRGHMAGEPVLQQYMGRRAHVRRRVEAARAPPTRAGNRAQGDAGHVTTHHYFYFQLHHQLFCDEVLISILNLYIQTIKDSKTQFEPVVVIRYSFAFEELEEQECLTSYVETGR